MTTLELVRHGDAQGRGRWEGNPDRDRPLTEAGHAQADALAEQLVAAGPVDAVYSSPLARCLQTVGPLARALPVTIRAEPALAEATTLPVLDGGDAWVASAWLGGRAVGLLDRIVRDHPHHRVVACSHGDVIPAVMAVLVGRDDLPLADVRLAKGARFSLQFDGARCVRAVPVPPPNG